MKTKPKKLYAKRPASKRTAPKRIARRRESRLRIDRMTAWSLCGGVAAVQVLLFAGGWLFGAFSSDAAPQRVQVRAAAMASSSRAPVVATASVAPRPQSPLAEFVAALAARRQLAIAREAQPAAVPQQPVHFVAARSYDALIDAAAMRHALSPELIRAMTRVESDFDPLAVSHKGARGLMQVMPATAKRFGVTADQLFDPAANIAAGTAYLAWLLDRFNGNLDLALAAYNAGEGAVKTHGGIPPYRETREYVRRVRAVLERKGVQTAGGRMKAEG
jgi:soluble lytic murein transglycosylase-like protein